MSDRLEKAHRLLRQKAKPIALAQGWEMIDYQRNIGMASFRKDGCRLNVYLTTMNVATALNHPTQGKTQMHRACVTWEEFDEICKNPRVHTGHGYQRR